MAQKTKITIELIAKRGISIMPTMLQEKNERKRKYLEPKKYDEFKKKEDARDREHRLKKRCQSNYKFVLQCQPQRKH